MPLQGDTGLSFLDVRMRVDCAEEVPFARRRAITADLDRLMLLRPDVANMIATSGQASSALRQLVSRSADYAISPKRAQNIFSNVKAAIEICGGRQSLSKTPLSEGWSELWKTISGQENSTNKAQCSSFVRWCSREQIEPHSVNDDAIDAFYNFLCLEKPKPYARERVQALVRCWNKLSLERTAWPDVKLSLLPPLPKHGLTEGEFSKNFIDDLQYYRESALSGRLPTQRNRRFSETSKEKVEENPLREGSVDTYIRFLRLGASFLAKCRGAPLKSIEKLSGLLVPGAPEDIMEEAYNYYGKTRSLPSLLSALFSVAKWHVGARPDIIGRLETLREHLPHFDETMTDKYRRLLRELEPHDYAILYSLPTRIMKKIDRRIEAGKFLRRRDISEAKTAACIAILLYTPIRIKNLAAIKISENFILGRDLARLRFVAADTKQKREIDLPVHPNTIPVIRWYINNILPLVRRGGCTALFPGKSKATMSEDGLRNVIERVLEVHLRRLNPHFFRHLAAHVMLLEEPGCYAQIQILLGHRRIETTMKYYCGEEAEAALQHVARCLSAASEKFIMLAEGRSNVR